MIMMIVIAMGGWILYESILVDNQDDTPPNEKQ
jgi:hypothetical protein